MPPWNALCRGEGRQSSGTWRIPWVCCFFEESIQSGLFTCSVWFGSAASWVFWDKLVVRKTASCSTGLPNPYHHHNCLCWRQSSWNKQRQLAQTSFLALSAWEVLHTTLAEAKTLLTHAYLPFESFRRAQWPFKDFLIHLWDILLYLSQLLLLCKFYFFYDIFLWVGLFFPAFYKTSCDFISQPFNKHLQHHS